MNTKISFKKSIITKLIILILIATLIPMLIMSIFIYKNAFKKQQNEYIYSDLKDLVLHAENINNFFNQFNSLSNSLILDKTFTKNLELPKNDVKTIWENEERLRHLLLSNSNILELNLYMEKSDILYSIPRYISSTVVQDSGVRNDDWYKKTIKENNKIGISTDYQQNISYSSTKEKEPYMQQTYTFNKVYRGIDGNLSAVLNLKLSNESIVGLCKTLIQDDEIVILSKQDGQILYSNRENINNFESKKEGNGYSTKIISGMECLVLYTDVYQDMKLYKLIPINKISKKVMEDIIPEILIWIILITLVILLVVPFIIITITRPLAQITNKIAFMTDGAQFPRVDVKGNDEIALLANKYNEMSENLERLILSEYQATIAARNAQIIALQTQINPHFMGNMLQSIGNTIIDNHSLEAYKMLTSLSELLRYGYRAELKNVELHEEIEYIQRYLFLQKKRFEEHLNFEINLAPSVAKASIPKLIIQPIVENCIEHGFSDVQKTLNIFINAFDENETVVLTVSDNGNGMDPERLSEIQGWLKNDQDTIEFSEHIGIRNVFTRLKLIWKDAVSVMIDSKLEKGTTFKIKFPLK